MSLIDRYIFFLFARVFVLCFTCLTGIYIVGDFVGHLNEFINASDENGGLLATLGSYYILRVPWFFDLVGRVVALISAVFAITWLQRHNEMTALMAAGVSRWRILRPIVVAASMVTLLAALNREIVIPQYRDDLSQTIREWDADKASPLSAHYDHMTHILINGEGGIEKDKRILKPAFRLPLSMAHFARRITARSATRVPATTERPAGFLLQDVVMPEKIDELDAVYLDGMPVIYTRQVADWLKPGQCFVVSNISYSQLVGGRAWRQFASTRDLISGLANPSMDFGADVRVAVHARLVQPLLDMTLLFLGIPVVLSRESRNVFVAAGSCVAIVAIFFLIILGSHNLGMNYLVPASQAAWMPLMILIPWAVAASDPLRR